MKNSHPRLLIVAVAIALMASVGAALAQQAGGSCATGSGAGRAQGQARGQGQGQGWCGGAKETGQSGGGACVRLNQRLSDGSCTNQACGQAQAAVPAPQQSRRGQRGGGQR